MLPRIGIADIDPAEYELKTSVRSEQQRKRLQAEFARDQKLEEERQAQVAERETRRQAAERAAWDALPYAVRLARTRCTVCHAADNYMNQRHNRVGWELVILRMQYLNEAPLGAGERSLISAYLADTYPATGIDAWVEALQQIAFALAPLCFWLAWRIGRARFGSRNG